MTTVGVSDGALQAVHTVTGNALSPGAIDIVEDSHDFGGHHTYDPATSFTFHVVNTGQVAIAAPSVTIGGSGAGAYTPTNKCGASLAPQGTCTIDVAFGPAAVGAASASLTVMSSDGGSDAAGLSGTGTVHVTINRTGAGDVTSSQPGIDCGTTCGGDFSVPVLDLTAHEDPTTHLQAWSNCDQTAGDICTLDLASAPRSASVTFQTIQHTLTVYLQGTGGGSITANGAPLPCPGGACAATYDIGTMVTVAATPDAMSTFTSLTGGTCSGSSPACTLALTTDVALDAKFTLKQYTVTANASPAAGGAVSGGGTYDAGSTVNLAATPAAGYVFASWTGCASSTASCTISNLSANATVTANFTARYTVTANASPAAGGSVSGGGTYDAGATVNLVATPAAGYRFASWTGCSSATTTCTIASLSGNASVTASFTAQYTVTTSASPAAGGSVSGGGTFDAGATVALVATANPGYAFSSWTGCSSATTTCTITNLSASANVTAVFVGKYTVTTSASPAAGGSVSGGGSYAAGANVTLVATPSAGYRFASWTGCSSATSTCTLTNLSANASVTANFTAQYTVSTNANPAAGGSVSGGGTYDAGTTVMLVATPNAGYAFASWTGCSSSTASCTLSNLSGNASVTASFIARYTVSTSASPAAGGSVSGGGTYNAGATVTLTAVPSAGYRFASWTGCTSSTPTCTISNLAGNANVTAAFVAQYTVTATASPAIGGSVSGGGTYDTGSTVTLVATPGAGYRFASWTGCTSSTSTCTISNLAADANVTAIFVARYTVTTSASPAAGGSVSGGGTFDAGANVTMTATASSGYVFVSWSGCSSSTATCTISNLAANVSVTATFIARYTVSTNTNPSAGGSVSGGGFYDSGATVTLTATPNAGYAFSSWTGCSSTTATCTITNLSASTTVTANFVGTLGFSIGFGGDGTGGVSGALTCHTPSDCGQSGFTPGHPVGFSALADAGMVFGGWDSAGPCAGQTFSCSYTLSATRTNAVTAYFYHQSYTLTLGTADVTCTSGCSGSGSYARGTAMQLFGQQIVLTISPVTHKPIGSCTYDVQSWSGCDSSSGDTCSLTLNSDRTVTATFKTTGTCVTNP